MISGKVQGVFFRETSRRLAEKLHINGWIKNCPDGKVEAMITGEESDVERFIEFCKAGPESGILPRDFTVLIALFQGNGTVKIP